MYEMFRQVPTVSTLDVLLHLSMHNQSDYWNNQMYGIGALGADWWGHPKAEVHELMALALAYTLHSEVRAMLETIWKPSIESARLTYLPGEPVNTSATKKSCDRKRSTLRARAVERFFKHCSVLGFRVTCFGFLENPNNPTTLKS
jgi:hypothetical protein